MLYHGCHGSQHSIADKGTVYGLIVRQCPLFARIRSNGLTFLCAD